MKPQGLEGQQGYPALSGHSLPGYSPPSHHEQGFHGMPQSQHPNATAPPPQTEFIQQQPPVVMYSANTTFTTPGPYPMRATCPNCNANVMTETETTPGVLTYISCGVLFCLTGVCCCVPFCMRGCMDIEHLCPNCHHPIGLYKRLS